MTVTEFIYYAVYIGFALMGSVLAIVSLGTMLHAERRLGEWVVPFIIPIVAMAISLSSLLSGRSLKLAFANLNLMTESASGSSTWGLRLFTFTLLGVCVAKVLGQWFQRNRVQTVGASSLFKAAVFFFFCNNVLNSVFGTVPAFIHNSFYTIVVFMAAYAGRDEPLDRVLAFAKAALLGMMLLSLVAAIIKPDLALEPNYRGWIPGLSVRLWGVGSNANSIGPLALVFLLIEYMQPYQKKWLHWLGIVVTFSVLLLAQSKTAWGAFILVASVLIWYRVHKGKLGVDIRLILIFIFLLSLVLLAVMLFDPGRIWDKIASSQAGSDITTLTGRRQIWAVAVNEWLHNPLFGYGPEIWGAEHRQRIGMQFAFSAHNQFLQSLSAAGIFGFLSLITYLFFLGLGAFKAVKLTQGVSVALFLVILVRSISETPLVLGTLFNGDFLTHILLFMICLRGIKHGKTEKVRNNLPINAVIL
jgi:O-antigen ligase